jgi:hypothetical protein
MINSLSYILFLTFLSSQPLSHEEARIALEKNVFLTTISSLAQKSDHYFLFDIREKKIFLMSRGIVLREWIADQVRFTGDPVPFQPLSLVRKSIQFSELRHNISFDDDSVDNASTNKISEDKTQDNKKEDKFELEALEIDDMPTGYKLYLNGGISIEIRAQGEGLGATLKNAVHSFIWYTYYPILAIWSSLKNSTFTTIDISFEDEKEAQALFWASPEEISCVLLFPESGDREAFQF